MPPCRSSELVTLWDTLIWSAPEMQAFSPLYHPCDVTGRQPEATCDLTKILHCGQVNFGQYFIQRFRSDDQVGCCGSYQYRVRIEYYLQDSCENQQTIQDFFEALDELVDLNLGPTWQDNVLLFRRDTTFPNIRRYGLIDGRVVYFGTYSYFAEADNC